MKKINKGEKKENMKVEKKMKLELVINMKRRKIVDDSAECPGESG